MASKFHLVYANTAPIDPSSPPRAVVPVALLYVVATNGKRVSSPNRTSNSLPYPPKNQRDNRPSSRRQINASCQFVPPHAYDSPTDAIVTPPPHH